MNNLKDNYNFRRLSKEGDSCWEDILDRMIKTLISRGSSIPEKDLNWLLKNYYFLPNSPALLTAGNDEFYASACSAMPISDTMDGDQFSILEMLNLGVRLTKSGIGVGWNFSNLRSKIEPVKGKVGLTGGPVSFLKSYNGFLKEVTQCTRKAAAMGLLHVNHPDIMDFIKCKEQDGNIANFNLSVVIDDEFMNAVKNKTTYTQHCRKTKEKIEIDAEEVFNAICWGMYNNGEPGIMFSNHIKNDYFETLNDSNILANPCGESIMTYSDRPGEEYLELCVLGSINLPRFVKVSEKDKEKIIRLSVDLLNEIINLQNYVSPLQEKGMKKITRKIGIGVAGLSTTFSQMGIKYSSQEAKDFTKSIFKYIGTTAKIRSSELYQQDNSILLDSSPLHSLKRMNASLISVAPTSTLSSIFDDVNKEGCSFGLEPYFDIEPQIIKNSYGEFERNEKIVEILGIDKAREVIEIADDLSYIEHLGVLEAYYEANEPGITMSASKTINFKNNTTIEDVKKAVFYCWEHKIKAFTFYRSGSRKDQVMNRKEDIYKDCVELDPNTNRPVDIFVHQSPKRPEFLDCDIYHTVCKSEKWLVLVGLYNGKPYEVFAGLEENITIPKKYDKGRIQKKKGYNLFVGEGDDELIIKDIPNSFQNSQYAGLTRLLSFSLRHGGPLRFAVEQLQKVGDFDAFTKVVSRCLKKYISDNEGSKENCPNCSGTMKYISGCPTCIGSEGKAGCGYSKCS